jgi:hypothetical protein
VAAFCRLAKADGFCNDFDNSAQNTVTVTATGCEELNHILATVTHKQ